MLVTITEFSKLAQDANGECVYLGDDRIGCQSRTAAGAFTALSARTRFIRIATDTAIQMDITGSATSGTDELFPANSVEYIAVKGGETLTFATVA